MLRASMLGAAPMAKADYFSDIGHSFQAFNNQITVFIHRPIAGRKKYLFLY